MPQPAMHSSEPPKWGRCGFVGYYVLYELKIAHVKPIANKFMMLSALAYSADNIF